MRNCGKQSSKGSRLKKYAQTSAGNEDEHGRRKKDIKQKKWLFS